MGFDDIRIAGIFGLHLLSYHPQRLDGNTVKELFPPENQQLGIYEEGISLIRQTNEKEWNQIK